MTRPSKEKAVPKHLPKKVSKEKFLNMVRRAIQLEIETGGLVKPATTYIASISGYNAGHVSTTCQSMRIVLERENHETFEERAKRAIG